MNPEQEWDGEILGELSPEWARRIIFLPECGSTNDEARRLALKGAAHHSLVLTESQTAGRGRRGQAWTCPQGEGLACSLIVRPEVAPALWSRHALAAGLALAEALDGFGLSAGVKWPNDVWVDGKKICGILVEAGAGFVIVGIGLNINVAEFPDDLAHPATSIALESGKSVSREEVLVSLLQRLRVRLDQIGAGFPELLKAWSTRCVLSGYEIELESGGEIITGRMEGLSSKGELLVHTPDGVRKFLQANTIRLR
ncbi:biotin--[acetyl-CoA-carboxylase] ligase [Verrucomicrobiaceae bacterium 227]